jgi:hypothetical protein
MGGVRSTDYGPSSQSSGIIGETQKKEEIEKGQTVDESRERDGGKEPSIYQNPKK